MPPALAQLFGGLGLGAAFPPGGAGGDGNAAVTMSASLPPEIAALFGGGGEASEGDQPNIPSGEHPSPAQQPAEGAGAGAGGEGGRRSSQMREYMMLLSPMIRSMSETVAQTVGQRLVPLQPLLQSPAQTGRLVAALVAEVCFRKGDLTFNCPGCRSMSGRRAWKKGIRAILL